MAEIWLEMVVKQQSVSLLTMYKLGAFEFLEASEHIVVQQLYIFGEILSHSFW